MAEVYTYNDCKIDFKWDKYIAVYYNSSSIGTYSISSNPHVVKTVGTLSLSTGNLEYWYPSETLYITPTESPSSLLSTVSSSTYSTNVYHKYCNEDGSAIQTNSCSREYYYIYTLGSTWRNSTKVDTHLVKFTFNNSVDSQTIAHSLNVTPQATTTRSTYWKGYSTTLAGSSVAGTKTGYHFNKWLCKSDGNYYSAGGTWGVLAGKGNTSTNYIYEMWATWTPNTYTIKYNANKGEGSMTDTEATYDTNVTLRANTFTRTGFTFGGWSTGSETYSNGQTVSNLTTTNGGTVTLYAIWNANEYTTTFNLNGGTFDNDTKWGDKAGQSGVTATRTAYYYYVHSKAYYRTGAATKTGYSFNGWWTSTSNGSRVYDANGAVINGTYWLVTSDTDVKWIYPGNLAVYAQWLPNIYSVTLNTNGGSGGTTTIYRKYGVGWYSNSNATTSITKIPSLPTRSGYTFGYYGNQSGGTHATESDGTILASTTYAGNITWYAQWIPNSYTVKYNANGGTGTMSNQSFTYDETQQLSLNTFTKTGYAFRGWATSASGTIVYTDGQTVSNLTTTNGGTVTLYAVWGPVSQVNIGGNWKVISGMKVKIEGNWKTVTNVQVKVGNVWKPWGGFGT